MSDQRKVRAILDADAVIATANRCADKLQAVSIVAEQQNAVRKRLAYMNTRRYRIKRRIRRVRQFLRIP